MFLIALAAIAVATVLIILTINIIKNWFSNNNSIINRHKVNVILKQKLKSGKYKTVGGIFDPVNEKILSATAWESNQLDDELMSMDRVTVLHDF